MRYIRFFLFTIILMLLPWLNFKFVTQAQEFNGQNNTDEEEFEEYIEEGSQIESPNTKEYILQAKHFFDRAENTKDRESAKSDIIEGLTRLQEILSDPKFSDDVIYNKTEKVYQGAKIYVRNLIRTLGPKVLKIYQQRYEISAQSDIEKAIFNKDSSKLKSIVMEYPFSKSASKAGLAAARILIEENKLVESISILSRIIARDDVNKNDKASAVAQTIFCYVQLGWLSEAEDMLDYAKTNLANERIIFGHKIHDLISFIENQIAKINTKLAKLSYTEQFRNDGGNLANTKIATEFADPKDLRWEKSLLPPTRGPKHSYQVYYPSYDVNLKRSFPVVSNSTVYVPNRNTVSAYELYTGLLKWRYENRIRNGETWIQNVDPAVIYTASCDNNFVYAPIEESVPYDKIAETQNRSVWGVDAIIIPAKRKLVCLEQHSGKIVWEAGGSFDNSQPLYQQLSYPVTPLIVGDTVYTIGAVLSSNAHFFLVAFDKKGEKIGGKSTGKPKIKWITKIATGQQEINMFGRPTREPFPLGLAFQSNLIFTCTNVGVISTIEAQTGEIIWTAQYERIRYVPQVTSIPSYRKLTWFNRQPMIYKGNVIFAPLDSAKMFCFDLKTGKLNWDTSFNPFNSKSTYLIGIHNNKALFGGGRYFFSADIKSGRLRDSIDLYEETSTLYKNSSSKYFYACAKPLLVKNLCLIPVKTGIIQINLPLMKVEKVIETDYDYDFDTNNMAAPDGNLLAAEHVLISVNSKSISVCYNWNKIIENLKTALLETPDDFNIKLKIGSLLLEGQKQTDAIKFFKEVLEMTADINSDEAERAIWQAKNALFNIYFTEIKKLDEDGDYENMITLLYKAEPFVQTMNEYFELMLIKINWAKQESKEKAIPFLNELSQKYPDEEYAFPRGEMTSKIFAYLEAADFLYREDKNAEAVSYWQKIIELNPDVNYLGQSISIYCGRRIAIAIRNYGRKVYEKYDKIAAAKLAEGTKKESEIILFEIIEKYPNSSSCEQTFYEISKILIKKNENKLLMSLLQDFLAKYPKSEYRPETMFRLFQVYEKQKLLFAARNLIYELQSNYKGLVIKVGSSLIDIDKFTADKLKSEKYQNLEFKQELGIVNPPIENAYKITFESLAMPKFVKISGKIPKLFEKYFYIMHSSSLLECRDNETGEEVYWTTNLKSSIKKAFFVNEKLVIITTRSVVSINPINGEKIWEKIYDDTIINSAISDGFAVLVKQKYSEVSGFVIHIVTFINTEDSRIFGEYEFTKLTRINDVKVKDKYVLISAGTSNTREPEVMIGFDIRKPDKPAFMQTFSNRLKHYNIILTGKNYYAILTQDDVLRTFEISNSDSVKKKNLERVNWSGIVANEKAIVVSLIGKGVAVYDPASLSFKWKADFRDLSYIQEMQLDDEKVYVVYRTRRNNFFLEAFDVVTGDRLWKRELTSFKGMNNYVSLLLTKKHIVPIMLKSVTKRYDNSYYYQREAIFNVVKRSDGEILQSLKYNPLPKDSRSPEFFAHQGNLYIQTNTITCFKKK